MRAEDDADDKCNECGGFDDEDDGEDEARVLRLSAARAARQPRSIDNSADDGDTNADADADDDEADVDEDDNYDDGADDTDGAGPARRRRHCAINSQFDTRSQMRSASDQIDMSAIAAHWQSPKLSTKPNTHPELSTIHSSPN